MFWLLECSLATSKPMMVQDGPKWSQDASKMAPRRSQDGPEMAPESLRMALEINEKPKENQ